MQKKITISLDEAVYDGLSSLVGRGKISKFIEDLVRPHVIGGAIDEGYRAMAADPSRESAAREWIDALAGDSSDEAR
jgi:hypothetical protein